MQIAQILSLLREGQSWFLVLSATVEKTTKCILLK